MISPDVIMRTLGVGRCAILSVTLISAVCVSHALAGSSAQSDDDIVLTPWWRMRFSVGEDARVDCGVFTGGDAEAVAINWIDPSGKTIATNSSARSVQRDSTHLTVNHRSYNDKIRLIFSRCHNIETHFRLCMDVWAFIRRGYPLQMVKVLLAGNEDTTKDAFSIIPPLRRICFNTVTRSSMFVIIPLWTANNKCVSRLIDSHTSNDFLYGGVPHAPMNHLIAYQ